MRNRIHIILSFILFISWGCSQKGTGVGKNTGPSLSVKRNAICNDGVICAKAAFKLNSQVKDADKMLAKMDKELIKCFTMTSKTDTVLPVAVERVNYGIADEMVYVLYFENTNGDNSNKKIIYNDRFFGWKNKEFIIDRN